MKAIERADVQSLLSHREPSSVSILMPTQRTGPETRQNPIRFKNLLGRAEQQLRQAGVPEAEAARRLAPLRDLLGDREFWERRSDGMAAFLRRGSPLVYRVPFPLDEVVVVGERFHVKPLLPLLADEARFHILAVSQTSVRLLEASRYDVRQVPLEGVPRNFDEVKQYTDFHRDLEFHTGRQVRNRGGKRTAMFHGHGGGADDTLRKPRLLEYCQMIDRGIQKHLRAGHAPLLLAAAEPLLSLYREANTYPHLDSRALHGSPDLLEPQELHRRAVEALADLFDAARQREAARYRQAAGTGQTSNDLHAVLPAAHFDQVDSLFVDVRGQAWGQFDPATRQVRLHDAQQPGDEDLLNLAAVRTLSGGGRVYAVPQAELPDQGPVAAIFRFPRA